MPISEQTTGSGLHVELLVLKGSRAFLNKGTELPIYVWLVSLQVEGVHVLHDARKISPLDDLIPFLREVPVPDLSKLFPNRTAANASKVQRPHRT